MNGDSKRWFVAHTQSQKEVWAISNLERQGFDCFLPRLWGVRRHARKEERVKKPLFTGYVFVKLDPTRDRWRSVNGTSGVHRLVMANDLPLPVPDGIVEELIEAIGKDGVVDLDRGLRPGDTVRLQEGPFGGFVGELRSMDEKGRVEVLLNLMNSTVRVHTERCALEPVR